MKTFLNKIILKGCILFFCLSGHVAHADVPAPEPPEDPLPINENMTIAVFIAVLFGIYIIYNYKLNKKRPI
ncbi:hypothetical protein [Flavobacterium sp. HJJ]|uniref:hypothetical protein n=1 Tax=Flavobacterium sp. HJJ TaxID=2783792 RepID=UPI00188A1CED|nr:hypothetical protein [Flavobacterium sp. HJJ]MBF4470701.1 hypothetical protein [Flavobacterium sp. HJJ]